MAQRSSKKRGPKTLIVVLKSLMDMEFVIEMKNDTEILGVLDQVDDGMKSVLSTSALSCVSLTVRSHVRSCIMHNATQTTSKGEVQTFDLIYVLGRMIRYVHIPDHVDIVENLNRYVCCHIFHPISIAEAVCLCLGLSLVDQPH